MGQLALSRGGPLTLPASKKTRALLGYLIAIRSPQPRQRLCDLLWDGPDDPRAALRWSLTKLRPLLDEPGVVRLLADRESVSFDALGARVDLFDADREVGSSIAAASTDALRRAAAALSGDFLEGLDLPDCYRFHEWCTAERERMRARRLSILDALVDRLTALPEDALTYARQRVAMDPLSDVAQAAVVRLLAGLGRRAEAQAQVDTCRRILDRELNGRRSPALDLARLEIGKPSPAPAPAPARLLARAPALPLVARTDERAAIATLVRDADEASARSVLLLSGEPGIGKSRLLDELAAQVTARGGTVLAARAFEAESVRPYGIWIDILRAIPQGDVPSELRAHLAPLLPELGESANDAEKRARLFDGVARLLREQCNRGLVAIVIDDLHWLDEASSGLLHYVARVSDGTRVAIACATRDGELSDNAGAHRLVRALRREGRLVQLSIEPLDEPETAELVRSAFPELDAARVFRESGGNPLFAIEVARSFAGGSPAGDDAPVRPRALEALLEERLERLDGRARDLVVWAAALGRTFDAELLVRVTGENFAQTIAAIGDLEQHGLLTSVDANAYSFTHELVRQAAYRQLSGPRRRLVHLAIARVLAAALDPGAAWGDVVHHATLAEAHELTARACVAAAQRCLRLHARSQAKEFAARGLAQVARLAPGDGLSLRLVLLQVAAYSSSVEPAKNAAFEEEARQAVRVARELGRGEDEAAAHTVLSFFRHSSDDFEGARANTMDAVEAARGADPVANVATMAHSAFCLLLIEREVPKARALLEEAGEVARTHRLAVTDVELGIGTLLQFEGDRGPARASLERAVALAKASGDSWRESIGLTRLAMLGVESEDWEHARRRAAELRGVATKFGDGTEGITADALDALALHGSGHPEGRARVDVSAKALANADAKGMLAFVLTLAAEIELRTAAPDRESRARTWATLGLAAAEPLGRPSAIIMAHVALGRAELAIGGGPMSAAAHFSAAKALASDPSAISKRARDALRGVSSSSNAGTNADPPGAKLKQRRR